MSVSEEMAGEGGVEAEHRKRRVDDLILESIHHSSSSFKKLSNGKFSCLVCSNSPILDSPVLLSMHSKGARHQAVLNRLREKDLVKQAEINKRIALSSQDNALSHSSSRNSSKRSKLHSKPLTEQT